MKVNNLGAEGRIETDSPLEMRYGLQRFTRQQVSHALALMGARKIGIERQGCLRVH